MRLEDWSRYYAGVMAMMPGGTTMGKYTCRCEGPEHHERCPQAALQEWAERTLAQERLIDPEGWRRWAGLPAENTGTEGSV